MRLSFILLLISAIVMGSIIVVRLQPSNPTKKIEFPIVNDYRSITDSAAISNTAHSLTHWSLIKHEIVGESVYFHYKQHKTDSLRRIIAGYDVNHVWTIKEDKKYIK